MNDKRRFLRTELAVCVDLADTLQFENRMELSMIDQRKQQRTELSSHVDLADASTVRAINISENGIRITSPQQYSKGTLLFIIIPLRDRNIEKGLIKVIGEIKWSKPVGNGIFENGLEFFCINDFDRTKVNGYIVEKKSMINNRVNLS